MRATAVISIGLSAGGLTIAGGYVTAAVIDRATVDLTFAREASAE